MIPPYCFAACQAAVADDAVAAVDAWTVAVDVLTAVGLALLSSPPQAAKSEPMMTTANESASRCLLKRVCIDASLFLDG